MIKNGRNEGLGVILVCLTTNSWLIVSHEFTNYFLIFNIMKEIVNKDECYLIIGKCMEVHNNLGAGLLEIVYKDALEYEFSNAGIDYEREKMYEVNYKGIILPHKFYADFVVYNNVILEVKGTNGISSESVAQAINYLKLSKNRLALIVNFGEISLKYKRVVI